MADRGKRRQSRSRSRSPHLSVGSKNRSSSSSPSGTGSRGRKRERRSQKNHRSNSAQHDDSEEHRSSSRGYSAPNKDTNSNDPRSVRCRVFVGNLAPVPEEQIIDHFQLFGKVLGVSVHSNFGFVQYNCEEEADLAVELTHGKSIFGKRVDCNIANQRRKPQGKDARESLRYEKDSPPSRRMRDRSISPERDRVRSLPSPRSRYDETLRSDYDRMGDSDHPARYNERHSSRASDDRYRTFPDDDDLSRGSCSRRDARHPPHQTPKPRVDCEIVLAKNDVSGYGELIETRLRSIGVTASIVFPEADVSVGETVERVCRRGALYSILVTEQNELHRSCTLNILYGTPQEHRNMPLEDALAFVARNFEGYLRALKDRESTGSTSQDSGFKSSLVQDADVASLLKLAAAGRILTITEIDKLIDALQNYRMELVGTKNASIGYSSNTNFYTNSASFSTKGSDLSNTSFGYDRSFSSTLLLDNTSQSSQLAAASSYSSGYASLTSVPQHNTVSSEPLYPDRNRGIYPSSIMSARTAFAPNSSALRTNVPTPNNGSVN